MIAATTQADEYWYFYCSYYKNTLIYVHKTSYTLPMCDISLG